MNVSNYSLITCFRPFINFFLGKRNYHTNFNFKFVKVLSFIIYKMQELLFVLIGTISGFLMGMVGVGGGAIIIISLLYLAHLPQKVAQGTTLLIVAAPVSLLAFYTYYKQGLVNLKAGFLIGIFFLLFSFIGAKYAAVVPGPLLRKLLGLVLILMGIKMSFFK